MKKKSIGKYISSIYRYQSIILNKKFERYGIGAGQYIFLIFIAENPGISQVELSHLVKIDRANTHRAIKKLLSLGYIHTVRDEKDSRIIRSYLTREGTALIPLIKTGLFDITEILVENFNLAERNEIVALLQKIEQNAQNYVALLKEDHLHDKEK